MYPIQIVGLGQGRADLTEKHRELIYGCDTLVGGRRLLDMFPDVNARRVTITRDIDALVSQLESDMETEKIVVLASGDPLFHGIGSSFCKRLTPDKFDIHSNISSIAAAFAAIKQPWHDAALVSLHGSQSSDFPWSRVAEKESVAFLTDPVRTPQFIARQMADQGVNGFRFCVIERLGDPENQRITWFEDLEAVCSARFDQPNIVILLRQHFNGTTDFHTKIYPGMEENRFRHSNGLITKSEIRSVSLAKLKLVRKDHVLWDIGAGSGSVSIEASAMIPEGWVYAIEKNQERIADITHNVRQFGCTNVLAVTGDFPECMSQLKTPDRVFVGGGGIHLDLILDHAAGRLSEDGIIVVNTVLAQNLETAKSALERLNFVPDIVQIQVSRGKKMPFGHRFEALNPVWIISGTRTRKADI